MEVKEIATGLVLSSGYNPRSNSGNVVELETKAIDYTKHLSVTEYGNVPNVYYVISEKWELEVTYFANGTWNRRKGFIRAWVDQF